MTILQSLTLSNIRRFGENVNIEIGAGATILLAPNGTGKTAIFEAIELALTRKVARLDGKLFPLVRDGQQEAKVILNFDDWSREISLAKDGALTINNVGNFADIFKDVNPADVPYLLRLTHLLSQRDRSWFVNQDKTEDAGEQLTKLPMGKEAAQVSAGMISVRRAMTKEVATCNAKLEQAKLASSRWADLLVARTNAGTALARPLIPLTELDSRLHPLLLSKDDAIVNVVDDIEIIQSRRAEAATVINQTTVTLDQRAVKLHNATNIVVDYDKAVTALTAAQAALELRRAENDAVVAQGNTAESCFKEKEQAGNTIAESLRTLQEAIRRASAVTVARKGVTTKEADVTQITEAIARISATNNPLILELAELEKLAAIHKALAIRAAEIRIEQEKLSVADEALARWKEDQAQLIEIEKAIAEATAVMAQLQTDIAKDKETSALREQDAATAKSALASVNAASGAIKSALGSIVAHLPPDQGDCPLCGVPHGPAELQRRVRLELEKINPELNNLAARVQKTKVDVETAAQQVERAQRAHATKANEREVHVTKRQSLLDSITALRQNSLLIGAEFGTAGAILAVSAKAIKTAQDKLDADGLNVPALSAETLARLQGSVTHNNKEMEVCRNKLAEAQAAYDVARQTLVANEKDWDGDTNTAELTAEQVRLNSEFAAATTAKEVAQEECARLQKDLAAATAQVLSAENNLRVTNERHQQLQAQWATIPLAGIPSALSLKEAEEGLAQEQTILANNKRILDEIEQELAQWRAADALNKAQSEIDKEASGMNEQAFSDHLEANSKQAKAELKHATERGAALETFSGLLRIETEDVKTRIIGVVPRWQALLNRIVRDPLFAKTLLDFAFRRNQANAEVVVKLSGKAVPAADIASEAQMTDLQLSFVLAMAIEHEWSPWKALLLDDPTQHHDLVHASAVFDVLRDYILDHGFQIVVATHDALQARFLMRKLMNDGISARIWTLVPTENGVVARQG
jgi:DNA repair protein SbcC/Rad50